MNKKAAILPLLGAVALAACGSDNPDSPSTTPGNGNQSASVTPAPSEIIYQANPRFFAEENALKAIQKELPRISSMGCDIIWLMPIFDPGIEKSVGSPYCIRDYKAINPRYGSEQDLRDLISEAHRLGMKVMLDWVANHTSFDHVWTISNPERYAKTPEGEIAATPSWGDVAQLDYSSPSTAEGMIDAMCYWADEFAIDGYRCDYTEGVPHEFWQAAIKQLRSSHPELIMLAESSQFDFYNDGFDMIYDWDFSPRLAKLFTEQNARPADLISYARESDAKVPAGSTILRYSFNHDVAAEHPVDTYFGSPRGALAAYTLSAMLGSTPMIYSGMDVDGLSGKQSFFDYRPLNFSETLSAEYGTINAAFKATAEARGGELKDYSTAGAICFTREAGDKKLLVIVNPSAETRSVKTPITLSGRAMKNLISGATAPLEVSVEMEPYGYLLLAAGIE